MEISRRSFLKRLGLFLGALAGPWSISGRKAFAATWSAPALQFLTPSEYRAINKMASEVIPDQPVLSGAVDVAGNIDRFFAEVNTSVDFLVMLRFLRLIRLADLVLPLLKQFSPLTAEDITSFKRTICFMGYYSDANGEAGMPAEKRIVWPRIGYGGPKPDEWEPPFQERALDRSLLPDRVKGEGL